MQEDAPKKILVVDDEPDDRTLWRKILSKKYIVTEACDGGEALEMARNDNPALILMDIMMPKVDGYSACCMIKRDTNTAEIPVVMLTGLEDELSVRRAEEIGASGYITKPSHPQELLDKIGQFL